MGAAGYVAGPPGLSNDADSQMRPGARAKRGQALD